MCSQPTAPELTTAQQAAVRGAQVWAAAWTPPPIWKTTNNKNGSQQTGDATDFASNKLQPAHYQDFANYLGQYVDLLAAANPPVRLTALSPANEPDYVATWDGVQWTPQELTTLIGQAVGPLFAQKYPSVKLMAPETATGSNCENYVNTLLADTTAAGYVSVIATHDYGGNIGNYDKPHKAGKSFWETEWSQENAKGDTPDPGMTSALGMAQRMHTDLVTSGMTAWSWWALYIDENGLTDNAAHEPGLHPAGREARARPTCSSADTPSGTGPSSSVQGSSESARPRSPPAACWSRRTATAPTWPSSPSTRTPAR